MPCSNTLRPIVLTLSTYGTATRYALSDQWVAIDDGAEAGMDVNIVNVTGNFQCRPATQLAAVRTDAPSAPSPWSGSVVSTAAHHHFSESNVGGTGNLYAQFGVAYELSSGSGLGAAQVILTPTLKSCVRMLPSSQIMVNPGMVTTTDINCQAMTQFLPAVGLSLVKCAFIVTDNASDYLEYQLMMRSAVNPNAPNAWQTVEAGWDNPSSSADERNTGELSAPAGASLSSNLLFQLGVGFRMKSGAGGNPRAVIRAIPAVVYV